MRPIRLRRHQQIEETGRRRQHLHRVPLDRRRDGIGCQFRGRRHDEMPAAQRPPRHVESADVVEAHQRHHPARRALLDRHRREQRREVVQYELGRARRPAGGQDQPGLSAAAQLVEQAGRRRHDRALVHAEQAAVDDLPADPDRPLPTVEFGRTFESQRRHDGAGTGRAQQPRQRLGGGLARRHHNLTTCHALRGAGRLRRPDCRAKLEPGLASVVVDPQVAERPSLDERRERLY